MKSTLFVSAIIGLLMMSACKHVSTPVSPASPPVATPVVKTPRAVTYLYTDSSSIETAQGTDSVVFYFHAYVNDTVKILFDTGREFIVVQGDTFKYDGISSPGDTLYLYPDNDVDLMYITADSAILNRVTYLWHAFTISAGISGHRIN
jgi:hypothetical protein